MTTTQEIPSKTTMPNEAPREQKASKAAVAVGALITAAVFGGVIQGRIQEHPAGETAQPASTEMVVSRVENNLNSPNRVAQGVTVEVGRAIPLKDGPDGAYAIENPIKLGKNTYGYIKPSLQHAGQVSLGIVEYQGTPPLNRFEGGYNESYGHEVTTPLAVMYTEYDGEGKSNRYYSVVMSDIGGDEANMINIAAGTDSAEYQREYSQQMGQIAENSVGTLLYSGK